jgi:dihydropteroate synthase
MIQRQQYTWSLADSTLQLGSRTMVMGILNVTPNSFSDGGEYFDHARAIERGVEIEQEGGDILDIGGESTHPSSEPVSEEEEMRRVIPVVERLAGRLRIPISVDTYRANVAQRALEAGALIINDISGLRFDPGMAEVVGKARAGLVLMHSRGDRRTLFNQPPLPNASAAIKSDLKALAECALASGIDRQALVLDPGFGFGKRGEENFEVLRNMDILGSLEYPLLAGTSRKSFIRSVLKNNMEAIAWGTAATTAAAILNGAHIVRVHDVFAARAVADATDAIMRN